MSELTVENIKKYMEADASAFDGVKGFGAISETSTLCLCIDFLIREIELLNVDARKFYQTGGDFILLESKEMVTEWRKQAAVVINKSSIELSELRSQLATIERDTAEKCAEIAESIVGNGSDFIEDIIAENIRANFNIAEEP